MLPRGTWRPECERAHVCVRRRDEEHRITALLLHIWAGTVSSSRGVTSTNLHVHAEETVQQENNFRT